jgi:hypothetical protein
VEELDEDVELVRGLILGPGFNRGPFAAPSETDDDDDEDE